MHGIRGEGDFEPIHNLVQELFKAPLTDITWAACTVL